MSNKCLCSPTLQSPFLPYHYQIHYLHNLSILMVILVINSDKLNAQVCSCQLPFAFWPQDIAASKTPELKHPAKRAYHGRKIGQQRVMHSQKSKLNLVQPVGIIEDAP